MEFVETPYNTIRVWLYSDEEINIIRDSREFIMFELLSVWNGCDKQEYDEKTGIRLYSWELPISLAKYVKERFYGYNNVSFHFSR
jgi:hypothetical protein